MMKLTFEYVNPIAHPEYYCGHGSHPATDPTTIPDEHWSVVEKIATKPEEVLALLDQYDGLHAQIPEGELVRNPRLFKADADIRWIEAQ